MNSLFEYKTDLFQYSDEREKFKNYFDTITTPSTEGIKYKLNETTFKFIQQKLSDELLENGLTKENEILHIILYKNNNGIGRFQFTKMIKIVKRLQMQHKDIRMKLIEWNKQQYSFNDLLSFIHLIIHELYLIDYQLERIINTVKVIRDSMCFGHHLNHLIVYECICVRIHALLEKRKSNTYSIYREMKSFIEKQQNEECKQIHLPTMIGTINTTQSISSQEVMKSIENIGKKSKEMTKPMKTEKNVKCTIITKKTETKETKEKEEKKAKNTTKDKKKKKQVSKLLSKF